MCILTIYVIWAKNGTLTTTTMCDSKWLPTLIDRKSVAVKCIDNVTTLDINPILFINPCIKKSGILDLQ